MAKERKETRIPLKLYTGGYMGDSTPASSYSLVNMYPEQVIGESDKDIILVGAPGCRFITNMANGQHRTGGATTHNDLGFFVVNDMLLEINTSDTVTSRGTLNSTSGSVSMSSNGTIGDQLTIVDGSDGYIWNTSSNTFSTITDPQFPANPIRTTFINGYTVILDAGSDFFYLSDFYDSSSYSSTLVARAERNPDGLVNCTNYNQMLWLLGETTTETWYNSPSTFPFDPIPNGFFQYGLLAADSLVNFDDYGLVWLSRDTKGQGVPIHVLGTQAKEIASPAIMSEWRTYSTLSDAVAIGYTINGHRFYQITFPTANKTWVCDLTSNYAWHERTFKGDRRHIATNHVFYNNMHLVGDYRNGNLYELDLDTYTDNNEYIIREWTTYHLSNNREKVRHVGLELELETGTGLLTGQGTDPQIWLSFSDDLGRTYGNKRYKDMGEQGKYGTRIRWPMLGSSRNRVYKFGMSDPVKIRVTRAVLDIRETSH